MLDNPIGRVPRIFAPVLIAMVLFLAAAACGGDPGSSNSGKLSGTIEIDGSSTVFPVSQAVAEEFHILHSSVRVNVGVSGTGAGFKRFTTGETDIADASRPMKPTEAQQAEDNGIEYYEFKVGIDGLSVMVNPKNDFVSCLTVAELKSIWEPGSTVRTWQDVRSEWPDKTIQLYGPGTDSGTFDYFTEEIVGEARASRADFTASEDDNFLVLGINGDKNSLGYFGYAYYVENSDKLKLVAIDDGDGCIAPSPETIMGGTYTPLVRPLFIYVNKESLERPEMVAFIEFYMIEGASLVSEVGYIAEAASVYQGNLALIR